VSKQLTINVGSGAGRLAKSASLRAPNPGDIMMALIFGWALLCFFLITVGNRLLGRIAGLATSEEIKELLLGGGDILGLALVAGAIVIIITVVLCHKYPRLFLASLLFSFSYAAAQTKFLHDVAFVLKYLGLIYLGAYAGLSLSINFWRIFEAPYVRIACLFTLWIAGISLFLGGQLEDIWYAGTVFSLCIGFGIFYVYEFNNRFGMEAFLKVLSWGAAIVVLVSLSAPIFYDEYIYNGRFQGYTTRATGLSVYLTPMVLILMWRAMVDKSLQTRIIYLLVSLAGFALILWSGSRSPTAATLLGAGLLWLRFRSKVFLVMVFVAALGIAAQVIFNVDRSGSTAEIASRLSNIETGRFELWQVYLETAAASPIYGYSASGLGFALAGELGGYLQTLGATELDFEAVHNAYLAIAMRFGLVGLALFLILLIGAVRMAKKVLAMPEIPAEQKDLIILPIVLILTISFTQFFEDTLPGTGKGTPVDLIFFSSLIICQVYGSSLINKYKNDPQRQIKTLDGFIVVAKPQDLP
jgi:O-antigen ligase